MLTMRSGQRRTKSADKMDKKPAKTIRPATGQLLLQLGFIGLLAPAASGDHHAGYAVVGGPGQGVDAGAAGAYQHDLSMGKIALLLSPQQGLQIGAAAGDQDSNAGAC